MRTFFNVLVQVLGFLLVLLSALSTACGFTVDVLASKTFPPLLVAGCETFAGAFCVLSFTLIHRIIGGSRERSERLPISLYRSEILKFALVSFIGNMALGVYLSVESSAGLVAALEACGAILLGALLMLPRVQSTRPLPPAIIACFGVGLISAFSANIQLVGIGTGVFIGLLMGVRRQLYESIEEPVLVGMLGTLVGGLALMFGVIAFGAMAGDLTLNAGVIAGFPTPELGWIIILIAGLLTTGLPMAFEGMASKIVQPVTISVLSSLTPFFGILLDRISGTGQVSFWQFFGASLIILSAIAFAARRKDVENSAVALQKVAADRLARQMRRQSKKRQREVIKIKAEIRLKRADEAVAHLRAKLKKVAYLADSFDETHPKESPYRAKRLKRYAEMRERILREIYAYYRRSVAIVRIYQRECKRLNKR